MREVRSVQIVAYAYWSAARPIFWSSDIDLPVDLEKRLREVTLEGVDLQAGERAILSLQLPEAALIVFDPVTHTAQFLEVRGEEVSERQ